MPEEDSHLSDQTRPQAHPSRSFSRRSSSGFSLRPSSGPTRRSSHSPLPPSRSRKLTKAFPLTPFRVSA